MRFGLRAIVETEDCDHITLKFGRKIDAAFANAIGLTVDHLVLKRNTECALHVRNATGELDGPTPGRRGTRLDREAKLLGKALDQLHGRRIGAMLGVELSARQTLFADDVGCQQRHLAPNNDRYGQPFG